MKDWKTIFLTSFWKQNGYHRHGVIIHTLRVTYEVARHREWEMLAAGLLHDIGKPASAFQNPEDILAKEYSFTDHEEYSYQLIKNWPFISEYIKFLVRHHYLIRRIAKATEKRGVYCWGKNSYGQLGTGNHHDSVFPLLVDIRNEAGDWEKAKAITTGENSSCAVI